MITTDRLIQMARGRVRTWQRSEAGDSLSLALEASRAASVARRSSADLAAQYEALARRYAVAAVTASHNADEYAALLGCSVGGAQQVAYEYQISALPARLPSLEVVS